jgi:hypothetical protein
MNEESVIRRAPDGTWGAPQAVPRAGDRAVVVAQAGARTPVRLDQFSFSLLTTFAWGDGTWAEFQDQGDNLNGVPELVFGSVLPAINGYIQGTEITTGPATAIVAGPQPDTLTIFAAYHGRLYALDRPAGPDTRAPRIDFRHDWPYIDPVKHTAIVTGGVDEAFRVSARAWVRVHGRWWRTRVKLRKWTGHPGLRPAFAGFVYDVQLHGVRGRCTTAKMFPVRMTITATDVTGKRGTRTTRDAFVCDKVYGPPTRPT